jgi:hypothetical protein
MTSWNFQEDPSTVSDPAESAKFSAMYARFEEEYHSDTVKANTAWAKTLSYLLEWWRR